MGTYPFPGSVNVVRLLHLVLAGSVHLSDSP